MNNAFNIHSILENILDELGLTVVNSRAGQIKVKNIYTEETKWYDADTAFEEIMEESQPNLTESGKQRIQQLEDRLNIYLSN